MTLQPVFVAKPTTNSFIYPRANGNVPGREAAFQLVLAAGIFLADIHCMSPSPSFYTSSLHMPLAAASAVCTDSLTYGWHFSLFVVVSCSVICNMSLCLVIIILAAPKSLYQHGGDTRVLWTT